EVRLTVDGQTLSQPLTVAMDPRAHPAPADLAAQHGFYQEVAQAMELTTSSQERVEALADRLEKLDQELAGRQDLQEAARRLTAAVDRFKGETTDESFDPIAGVLSALAIDVEGCDCAPIAPQREVFSTYRERLDAALARWKTLLASGPVSDLDRQVRAAGLAPVVP